jgi:hypothetical protein
MKNSRRKLIAPRVWRLITTPPIVDIVTWPVVLLLLFIAIITGGRTLLYSGTWLLLFAVGMLQSAAANRITKTGNRRYDINDLETELGYEKTVDWEFWNEC